MWARTRLARPLSFKGHLMTGFGIEETDDGFILRRGDEEIRMSKEEFFSLRSQMNLWLRIAAVQLDP
jgi:hypothetical protein